MESKEYHPEAESENLESSDTTQSMKKKKTKMKNKRRFSDEQIRSLECIFESETKLEPRKKLQVARELGLQPRQVAIWFQNKRARWKSKQIEKDYRTLKASYDSLASKFESLKKEKQSLLTQLQKLSEVLDEPEGQRESKILEGGSSENGDEDYKNEENSGILRVGFKERGLIESQIEHGGHEEQEIPNMDEYADCSLELLPEKWCGYDVTSMIDPSCNGSSWFNFWS